MPSWMAFAHGIYALMFEKFTHFEHYQFCRVEYVKIVLFHLKLRENCQMLGEFKCDHHVFVHLFRKNLFFNINGSTKFLTTQMQTFLANLSQNYL